MIAELFSVFDLAAARFIDPFPAPTVDFALRSFKKACQPGGPFAEEPSDFAIYHVGTMNMETGLIDGFEARKIGMASSFVTAPSVMGPRIDEVGELTREVS